MQYAVVALLVLTTCLCTSCGSQDDKRSSDKGAIRSEIEAILKIQDDAYDMNSEEGRRKLAATCLDDLMFVGGDNAGIANTADYYVHDLADGFIERPHDRIFRIFDHTVIVNAVHHSFKVFNHDTIYFHARVTKVFVRQGKDWKMAMVTFAPLPVNYTKPASYNSRTFSDYAGLYEAGPSAFDTISIVNGKVFISSQYAPRSELIPLNDSTFIGEGYVGKTIFSRDKRGTVTHNYFLFPDGQKIMFRKIQ